MIKNRHTVATFALMVQNGDTCFKICDLKGRKISYVEAGTTLRAINFLEKTLEIIIRTGNHKKLIIYGQTDKKRLNTIDSYIYCINLPK